MKTRWAVKEYKDLIAKQNEDPDPYYSGTDAACDEVWQWWYDLEKFHGEEFADAVFAAIEEDGKVLRP